MTQDDVLDLLISIYSYDIKLDHAGHIATKWAITTFGEPDLNVYVKQIWNMDLKITYNNTVNNWCWFLYNINFVHFFFKNPQDAITFKLKWQ